MDDATGFIWSYFIKKKLEVTGIIVKLIKHLKKAKSYDVKYLRCDNTRENLKTKEECLAEGRGVTFEFTAVNMPQQNGRAERRYATLYGRVRGMMNIAKLNRTFRCGLLAECARTATILDNLDCDNKSGKTRCYLLMVKTIMASQNILKCMVVNVDIVNKGEPQKKVSCLSMPQHHKTTSNFSFPWFFEMSLGMSIQHKYSNTTSDPTNIQNVNISGIFMHKNIFLCVKMQM